MSSEQHNDDAKAVEIMQDKAIELTDELIADYLQADLDFFNRNPALLTQLRLSDPHRGTVSLVERQQQQLRQKVQSLEEEITQLMSIANNNEQLFSLYSDMYLYLIDCKTGRELLDCLTKTTTELLSLSAIKLWLHPSLTADIEHDSISRNDCAGVMQNRLTKDAYYFGRIQHSEQQLIFSQAKTGSVVLIRLEHQGENIGFLAISSDDAEHFDPRMDTLLLNQFKKLLAKLLHLHLA